MSQISITNLTFAYDGSYDNVFDNTSFNLDTDWKLGLIGRNGKGKTTLLRLLLGGYEYSGCISASVAFSYFPFDIPNKSLDTLEVLYTVNRDFEQWELLKELSKLDVDESALYRPFATLSLGEQTKVLLAALFLRDNNFLLIDEPTNHLDMSGREIVSRYLNSKSGFILVSHDRAFLDGCIDHVLSINRKTIEVQKGNFSSWQSNKQARDSFELMENERLKVEISHLQTAAERTKNWSNNVETSKIGEHAPDRGYIGHKAAKMMKRSKSVDKRRQSAVDEKSQLLKDLDAAEPLKLSPLDYHKDRLVEINGLSISYNEATVCSDISFTVERGQRVALAGGNGSGKTSVIKLILGENISHTGSVQIGSGLIISYVCQDTSGLSGNLSDYALSAGIDESLFKAILRKLDFSRLQFEKDISNFSAGQKKKVLIARSLCEKAHLYIWDEPLNYVDVLSRIQIEELLLTFHPTLLFVEHDKVFSDRIATKTVEL